MKSKIKLLKDPRVLSIAVFAVAMLASSNGYCDGVETEIQGVTDEVKKILFSSTVRKVVLTIGGGAGLFQAFMSGSVRPLLIWGGLGLAVCYLPKFVEWIGSI